MYIDKEIEVYESNLGEEYFTEYLIDNLNNSIIFKLYTLENNLVLDIELAIDTLNILLDKLSMYLSHGIKFNCILTINNLETVYLSIVNINDTEYLEINICNTSDITQSINLFKSEIGYTDRVISDLYSDLVNVDNIYQSM